MVTCALPRPNDGVRGRPYGGAITAEEWHQRLYKRECVALPPSAPIICRFIDTQPDIEQPPLVDDVICLHRGGAKRVFRERFGRVTAHDVPMGSLTIMPRLSHNRWRTEGPVDFVHIVLKRSLVAPIAHEEFGGRVADFQLYDEIGVHHPLLALIGWELAREIDSAGQSGIYVESLTRAFTIALLRHYSTLSSRREHEAGIAKGGMAGWRLKRVLDFIEAELSRDISLADLAGITGQSRAQFYRAFTKSMGASPARYLKQRRVERARRLLLGSGDRVSEIAAAAGFPSKAAMSSAFVRELGMNPSHYRASVI